MFPAADRYVGVPAVDYGASGNIGCAAAGAGEMVQVLALDSLNLPRLDFMKIDVEGTEAEVLAGVEASIRRHRPVLFVENNRREKSPELIGMIQALGYRAWRHFSPLYRQDNFNAEPVDVMSINLRCLPAERSTRVDNLRAVVGPRDWWKTDPASALSD